MGIALSIILPGTGVDISFYVSGLIFVPLLIIMARMKNSDAGVSDGRKSFRQMGFGRLFKNYYFVTYLIFTVFLMMPINTSGAFLPYLLESEGGDPARLGLVIGYKALLEIPTLLLMKPLRRRFPLPVAILCSGLLYFLEALLFSRANSLTQILVIQTVEGLGGGLMIGAAASYVYSLAPEGLTSTAVTLNGTATAIVSASASSGTTVIKGNVASHNSASVYVGNLTVTGNFTTVASAATFTAGGTVTIGGTTTLGNALTIASTTPGAGAITFTGLVDASGLTGDVTVTNTHADGVKFNGGLAIKAGQKLLINATTFAVANNDSLKFPAGTKAFAATNRLVIDSNLAITGANQTLTVA
jgi:hypothetical protein